MAQYQIAVQNVSVGNVDGIFFNFWQKQAATDSQSDYVC